MVGVLVEREQLVGLVVEREQLVGLVVVGRQLVVGRLARRLVGLRRDRVGVTGVGQAAPSAPVARSACSLMLDLVRPIQRP